MPAYVEVYRPAGLETFLLDGGRCTLGKDPGSDLVISEEETVSRIHAALEAYGDSWCLKDLGSTNGTYVNGERIWGDRVLRDRDEIQLGRFRLVFRAGPAKGEPMTATAVPDPPPYLTRREREVLTALCRPNFQGDYFSEPASVKQIAKELYVTEAAVKQHLSRLYDKFSLYEGPGERRIRLANEALRRGAVTIADLRAGPPEPRADDEDET